MTMLIEELGQRHRELLGHLELAKGLEDRMLRQDHNEPFHLSAGHINTLKSGLIIHTYNIVESIMSQAMLGLNDALKKTDPRRWTEKSLREWLRGGVVARSTESNQDGRVKIVLEAFQSLLRSDIGGERCLTKPSGTWDDKKIATFLQRMDVSFYMPEECWRKIAASPAYGDRTPLEYLADRRNAIAHGRRPFDRGAHELDLQQIEELALFTMEYLKWVAEAVQNHITERRFLVPVAE